MWLCCIIFLISLSYGLKAKPAAKDPWAKILANEIIESMEASLANFKEITVPIYGEKKRIENLNFAARPAVSNRVCSRPGSGYYGTIKNRLLLFAYMFL